jgi:hypothetical protein
MIIKLTSLLLLIILITLIYIIIYYSFKEINPLTCKCFDINYTNNLFNKKIIKKLFDDNFCNDIINEGEEYANKYNWSTDRHDDYPTTDNEINSNWKIFDKTKEIIYNKLFPKIEELFNVDKDNILVKEVFLVKYDMNNQKSLDYHIDGSQFSFVITLNEEFEEGGTKFFSEGKTYKLNKGDCLIFNGKNKHCGVKITSGTRYILTGFLDYVEYDFCTNYNDILKDLTLYILMFIAIFLLIIKEST